jgi:hypothetical protein
MAEAGVNITSTVKETVAPAQNEVCNIDNNDS